MWTALGLGTLAVCLLQVAATFSFAGFELLSVETRRIEDVMFLNRLAEEMEELDFWRDPTLTHNATVLVPPSVLARFKQRVWDHRLRMSVINADVQALIDAGSKVTPDDVVHSKRTATGRLIDHTNYHSYDKINAFLEMLRATYPNYMELSELDHYTHENRPVTLVKLHNNDGREKPVIILETGIHAREWISPASNLFAMEEMLRGYTEGETNARQMLDNYDWFLIPVTNPDGYEYSHSHYRLWRKNRRIISNRCIGIDLNRNFNAKFATTGVSPQCSSNMYPGENPFSEPETANILGLVNRVYHRLVAYMSVHSFAQFVLVPWGYTENGERPSNAVELDRMGDLLNRALSDRHNQNYTRGTAFDLLNYAASGASEDWALTYKPGIYAYCYELRPHYSDPRGFVLPPEEIIGTGEEYLDSLRVLSREIKTGVLVKA